MPRTISTIIGQLEELYKKIEYEFEDFGVCDDESLHKINDAIDSIVEINDELDRDLEQE